MKAHDVRHLAICPKCSAIGDDREMIQLTGQGNVIGDFHDRCAFLFLGIEGILDLPDEQRRKFTLGAIGPEAMKRLVERSLFEQTSVFGQSTSKGQSHERN